MSAGPAVREALRSLSVIGIIESRPRRGTTVVSQTGNSFGDDLRNSLTKSGLADVFEVRLLLERHAASRAAQHATPAELDSIAAAADAVERRAKAGRSYFSENARFHLKIAEAAHNPVLAHCLQSIISSLRDVREHANALICGMPEQDIDDHRRILKAIRSHNVGGARRSMEAHLSRTARKLLDRQRS